jgi:nucleoside-diphosphate-sugar epimerase
MDSKEGPAVRGAHLVTGGAGFIGRWVVKQLLDRGVKKVVVLDDFSNSNPRNLEEFASNPSLVVLRGSICDRPTLRNLWAEHGPFETVYHLAASIRVQDSIDDPRSTFTNDVVGTFEVLEACRQQYFQANGISPEKSFRLDEVRERLETRKPRVVFMSTCMVYGRALDAAGINEGHETRSASPYAASKIAAENLSLSYYWAYGLPVKVLRPFNTYGPFQKRNLEGGVVAIFIARDLRKEPLLVKGDGTQTRDLLYVEDCARFVVDAGLSERGDGELLNAGLGEDITIRDLARLIADPTRGGNGVAVEFVAHDHPQAEIAKLLSDNSKAARVLGWRPSVTLEEGVRRTREWIRKNSEAL